MGLNKEIAARLAEDRLAKWRRLDYRRWCALVESSDLRDVVAEDGKRYSVRSYALDDGDGRVRMVVAVDDGGWSAWSPLCRDEIMNPDGTLIE